MSILYITCLSTCLKHPIRSLLSKRLQFNSQCLLSRNTGNSVTFFLLPQEPAYLTQVKWRQISKGKEKQFEKSGSSRSYSVRLMGGKQCWVRRLKNRGFENSGLHYPLYTKRP